MSEWNLFIKLFFTFLLFLSLTATSTTDHKTIKSLVPTKDLLTTTGNHWEKRQEWTHTTINLGKMKQEQIIKIYSTANDSYTEHKVAAYNYHYASQGGIHHGPNFRNYFFEDKVDSDWDYNKAVSKAYNNFNSIKEVESNEKHWATGTIKFYHASHGMSINKRTNHLCVY